MIGTQGSMVPTLVQYWGRLPGIQYPTAHWRRHVAAARSASRCAFEVAWFGGVIGAKITPLAIARRGLGAWWSGRCAFSQRPTNRSRVSECEVNYPPKCIVSKFDSVLVKVSNYLAASSLIFFWGGRWLKFSYHLQLRYPLPCS